MVHGEPGRDEPRGPRGPDRRASLFHDLVDDGEPHVPNHAEQAVIAKIPTMRAARLTLERIAAALTDQGVPTKTGKSERWTHQAVARILKREYTDAAGPDPSVRPPCRARRAVTNAC